MDSRPKLTLPPELWERCAEHGRRTVGDFERNAFPNSGAFSSDGIDRDPFQQARAKAAECLFTLWAGLDPRTALAWRPGPDDGGDVEVGHTRVDVKGTNTTCLIWPVTKNHFLAGAKLDVFVCIEGCLCLPEANDRDPEIQPVWARTAPTIAPDQRLEQVEDLIFAASREQREALAVRPYDLLDADLSEGRRDFMKGDDASFRS
jgi:hypothetical protein